jgi:TetR/AcrR family transcriptional regulator, regulator of autoinduction and epiphytic fitness
MGIDSASCEKSVCHAHKMGLAAEPRDGRTVRGERTRRALVDALLALLDAGELRPTAERIAERAGVSERSLFQHFPDREQLFEAVARQQYERVLPTLQPVDASLSLPDRIDAFVDQRARFYELSKGVRRAALLLEPESGAVAGWLSTARKAGAADAERVFRAELERIADAERPAVRAALVSAAAWTSWEAYRFHQGLSVARARAAMRATIAALLGEG